jgi:hypothetical protein
MKPQAASTKWIRALIAFWVVVWVAGLVLLYTVDKNEERGEYGFHAVVAGDLYSLGAGQYGGSVDHGTASAWMMGVVVLAGISYFYARRRFSLGALIILMICAGLSGLLPRWFENRGPQSAFFDLKDFTPKQSLALPAIYKKDLSPAYVLAAVPKPLLDELQLSAGRVRFTIDAADVETQITISATNQLTREQMATVFHLYASLVDLRLEKYFKDAGIDMKKEASNLDELAAEMGSRLGPYLKEWRAAVTAADAAYP